jgi:hypothetical protein
MLKVVKMIQDVGTFPKAEKKVGEKVESGKSGGKFLEKNL